MRRLLSLVLLLAAFPLSAAEYEPERGAQIASLRGWRAVRSAQLASLRVPLFQIVAGPGGGGGGSSLVMGTTENNCATDGGVFFNLGGVVSCDSDLSFATATLTITNIIVPTASVFGAAAAGAANAVEIGQTANCITYEGATADAFETFDCAADVVADTTWTRPGVNVNVNYVGRDNNGVVLSNGSTPTALFGVFAASESITTTKTTSRNESGELYVTGDTDGQTITLANDPSNATMGWLFCVTQTQSSNSMAIVPSAGETLYDGASACSSLSATAIGSCVRIIAVTTGSGGVYMTVGSSGTWTCTP